VSKRVRVTLLLLAAAGALLGVVAACGDSKKEGSAETGLATLLAHEP